jgi:hypothetical protein
MSLMFGMEDVVAEFLKNLFGSGCGGHGEAVLAGVIDEEDHTVLVNFESASSEPHLRKSPV